MSTTFSGKLTVAKNRHLCLLCLNRQMYYNRLTFIDHYRPYYEHSSIWVNSDILNAITQT